MRGCCLRLAGQHHLRPLMMLSMSMSVIAKSKLSFVYHCLLLLHLPLFLCRSRSAELLSAARLPLAPHAAPHRISSCSPPPCSQPGPVLAGHLRRVLAWPQPSKPHDRFAHPCFSAPSPSAPVAFHQQHVHDLCIELSHRHPHPKRQPFSSRCCQSLLACLVFALASATGVRPFGQSSASLSGVAFLRSFSFSFFFWFLLCVPFWWLGIAWVRADTRRLANALPCIGAATPLSIEPPSTTSSSLLHGRRIRAAARC